MPVSLTLSSHSHRLSRTSQTLPSRTRDYAALTGQIADTKRGFTEYFDWRENYFGMVEATEPIDYKTREAGTMK